MAAESRFNWSTLSPAFLMSFPVWDAFPAWLRDFSDLPRGLDFDVFFTSIPPIRSVDMPTPVSERRIHARLRLFAANLHE